MKRLKKYLLFLLATPLLVVTCMTIEDVTHPDNAQVDSDIDIAVRIKIVAETNGNSKLAFAVMAPKSWNLATSATLTLSTTALFGGNVVTNEPMTVIPSGETNPADALSWPASFQSTYGVMGNTGPVEWVVFESSTVFQIHDGIQEQKEVDGTVSIKLHTGPRAIKLFMGYAFCGKGPLEHNGGDFRSKILEVTGGDDPVWDYTVEPPISYVPATFGFEDIFSIKYNEPNSTVSGLKEGGSAYLLGKVKYSVNSATTEKTIDETNSKTLMEALGDMGQMTSWQKYIYPRDFFDLPENAVIEEIYVYFANQDKSITTAEYQIEPTCQ
jgi:hypothetical protein